jgi:hypothetical protein
MQRSSLTIGSFVLPALIFMSSALCSSCGVKESAAPPSKPAALPESFALASEPAGAKPVKEVIASVKSGDEVLVAGRVGVEGSDRAYFSLVDASLKACSETPMNDPCKTPWDFCCTPSDELKKLAATVEFRDGAALYSGSVLGFRGLDHLKHVVVKGKAEKDAAGNLTIVASGIFVKS